MSQGYMHQFDTALATGAVSSPIWVTYFEDPIRVYLIIGGALLLTFRLILAFNEVVKIWKERKSNRK